MIETDNLHYRSNHVFPARFPSAQTQSRSYKKQNPSSAYLFRFRLLYRYVYPQLSCQICLLSFFVVFTQQMLRCSLFCRARRSNNSEMTTMAGMAIGEITMHVDWPSNSLVFVGPDRSTVRSMSPDGSKRSIIHKTGRIIPGGIAYNSEDNVLFYIARSVRCSFSYKRTKHHLIVCLT